MRLRAHHLLCTALYVGEGYSGDFCTGMDGLVAAIRSELDGEAVIVCAADDICAACPHRLPEGQCGSVGSDVAEMDRQVIGLLGLTCGEVYKRRTLYRLLRERITAPDFERICGDCSWHKKGLCSYPALVERLDEWTK